MKKLILTLMILALLVPFGYARENVGSQSQSFNKPYVEDYKQIDVNQISAWVTNYGSIFRHPTTGNSGFEWPARGGVFAIYASGLWVGARVDDDPRVAVAEYSYEFDPGKIIQGSPDDQGKERYQVYKLARGDEFPDVAIEDGAPFEDINANDAYDPGVDETSILGDQFLWCVYNDASAATHVNMATAPLKVEIQQSVFAFARTGPLGNTVFVKWLVVNKSGTELKDTYISVWSDPDLGDSGDDFVGCDTTLSLGYVYNSNNNDGEYGASPPAAGYDFLQGPIVPGAPDDTALVSGQEFPGFKNLPMTSFVYYNNSNENNGNPQTGAEVYNYMQAKWRDGTKIRNDGGTGIGDGPETNYMFPGDPEAGTGWLDSSPADRRFMMTTGPFTMQPFVDENNNDRADIGEPGVQEIVVGVVVAKGANNLNSVTLLKTYDDLAQLAYDLNFDLAQPPATPQVEATVLSQAVVLNWNNDFCKDTVETYSEYDKIASQALGEDVYYEFQGYRIYQYSFADLVEREVVATYDLNDGVTDIRDLTYDEETGEFLEKLVMPAKDTGIKRFEVIKQDKFSRYPGRNRLINGSRYWFAVSAFGYSGQSSPKIIESTPQVFEITPEAPSIGSTHGGDPERVGENLEISVESDSVNIPVAAQLIDPTKATKYDYELVWDFDPVMGLTYTYRNVSTGDVIDQNTKQYTTLDDYESWPIRNGFQLRMGFPEGSAGKDTSYINSTVPIDSQQVTVHFPFQNTDTTFQAYSEPFGLNLEQQYMGGRNAVMNGADRAIEFRFLAEREDAEFIPEVITGWGDTLTNVPIWKESNGDTIWAFYRYASPSQGLSYVGTEWDRLSVPYAVYDLGDDVDDPSDDTRLYPIYYGLNSVNTPGNVLYDLIVVGNRDMAGNVYGSDFEANTFLRVDNFFTYWGFNTLDWMSRTDWDWRYEFTGDHTETFTDMQVTVDSTAYVSSGGDTIWTVTFDTTTWDTTVQTNYVDWNVGDVYRWVPVKNNVLTGDERITFSTPDTMIVNDKAFAKENIEKINVFPNPYYATHGGERVITEKWVEFTHLPPTCTIRIFTLSGALVRTINRDGVTERTWEKWNLQNESELPVASGLYIYHIDIPGVGEKIGKLAIFMPEERLDTF